MRSFFELDCGRSVTVDAFYYQRTYISLLEGLPNPKMNERILEKCRTALIPLWGKRKVHVVPPETDESDPEHPVMPPVQVTAWLTCYYPILNPNAGVENFRLVPGREERGIAIVGNGLA